MGGAASKLNGHAVEMSHSPFRKATLESLPRHDVTATWADAVTCSRAYFSSPFFACQDHQCLLVGVWPEGESIAPAKTRRRWTIEFSPALLVRGSLGGAVKGEGIIPEMVNLRCPAQVIQAHSQ